MKTIWKFNFDISDTIVIDGMPQEFEILAIQMQQGCPALWVKVDEDTPIGNYTMVCRGTGHELTGEEGKYLGTIQDGILVWHFFDALETK